MLKRESNEKNQRVFFHDVETGPCPSPSEVVTMQLQAGEEDSVSFQLSANHKAPPSQ